MIEKVQKTKKDGFWQLIRGICIIMVVLIHTCEFGSEKGTLEFNMWVALRQIINFPVAVFIFLSGYFVNPDKVLESPKAFLIKRGVYRLLIPFLIWSLFYTLISVVRSIASNQSISVVRLIYLILIGKAVTPLYYIVVLIQLTIITPFLVKWIVQKRRVNKWLWLVTPVYLLYIYAYNLMYGKTPMLYGTLFPAWFMFYYMGLSIRIKQNNNQKILKQMQQPSYPLVTIVALFISFLEVAVLLQLDCSIDFATSQIKLGSFLYAIALIIWFTAINENTETHTNHGNKNNHLKRFLIYIGNMSYGIYYIHCFFIIAIDIIFSGTILYSNWLLFLCVRFIGTTLCSFVAIEIVRRIAKHFRIEKSLIYVGFD